MPVTKVLISDLLTDIPFYPHDKLEGVAILNDSMIVVSNDDDFGVISDSKGGYLQKVMPSNNRIDNGTLYFVKLRTKLSNIGSITALDGEEENDFNGSKNELKVSPNPTDKVVYFSRTIANGKLIDVLGNTIMNITNQDDLDLSGIASGVYFLQSGKETVRILLK